MADVNDQVTDAALTVGLPRTALNAGLSFASLGHILDNNLGAIVSLIDLDTRLHYVNARFAKSFNMMPAEMIGKTLFDLYDESHTNAFMPYIRRAFAGEEVNYERLGPVVGSAGIWHTISVTPWRDGQGNIIGAATSSMRVHELKVKVEALRAANERLSSHMDNSPLTVIEFDDQLRVSRCSSQIHEIFGIPAECVVGRSLLEVLDKSEAAQPLVDAFGRLQSGDETRNRIEVALPHDDGRTIYSEWFNSALTDANGTVSSMMALVQDVTTRKLAEAQLRQIATHDPLTGLCNRRLLTERLEQSLLKFGRSHQTVAVLFIDLDEFKQVNDRHGHNAGDEVLCEIARRLRSVTREVDVVARLGGDEFVVLAESDVTAVWVDAICQRIMDALLRPCAFSSGSMCISASIGVALCPPACTDASELIRLADAAMYEAKRAGKGRVWHASNDPRFISAPDAVST